jgi:hypothetical protein
MLHLIKLCVGCESVDDLSTWQQQRLREQGRITHVTRMRPKRGEALLQGGSLYWVIKGSVRVRQKLLALDDVADVDGRRACALVLQPGLVLVEPRVWRPFQGWRYLAGDDAPPDLSGAASGASLPEDLAAQLRQLGFV